METLLRTRAGTLSLGHERIFWKCEEGHSWDDSASNMIKYPTCPFCTKKRASESYNLKLHNPILSLEWNYEKNNPLTPEEVTPFSKKLVWWTCSENPNHIWKTSISNRNKGRGCKICNNERQTSFPEQAIYYYIRNVFPKALNRQVLKEVKSKVFKHGTEVDIYIPELNLAIEYDGYLFHKSAISIKREIEKNKVLLESNIPLLRIREQKLSDLHDKEVFILKHDYYDPEGMKNIILDLGTFLLHHFDLDQMIKTKINEWSNLELPLDSVKILENMLSVTKESSVASYPYLVKEWHPTRNGELKPEKISRGTAKKYWWLCEKGHPFLQSPNKRTTPENERNCPFCHPQFPVNETNSFKNNYPALSEWWDYEKNGTLRPEDVSYYCCAKVYWMIKGKSVFDSPENLRNKISKVEKNIGN